ncbi:hypothetical protein CWI39_1793p0010 [Hamiltosporidium magnivora]|uniref:Uncharacterized protein n=1 Tax=Hamiltosporidium magnivora TaxID=148818 RepID=A0A4Q9KYK5_9MICR|nr:hypothetical protein CWI39_1793p0010 [Hamiltosporidium magnivora]
MIKYKRYFERRNMEKDIFRMNYSSKEYSSKEYKGIIVVRNIEYSSKEYKGIIVVRNIKN